MKVIILAGGRATRLPHSAKDIPKALVPIHGRTILDRQLDCLARHGLTDVKLSLGFRAEQIIDHLKNTGRAQIGYVIENEPLGTGGAVRFASQGLAGDFMVLNGDTLADFDFTGIMRSHRPGMPLIVSAWRKDARSFGLMDVSGNRIHRFLEKPDEPRPGFINAGCYLLHPAHFDGIEKKSFMLEEELFPRLAEKGFLRTFVHSGFWEDIGTEERLAAVRNQAAVLI